MICRLCLTNINEETAVPVFNDKEISQMISKHLFIELSPEDDLSTHICHDCFNHLEDFHKFCTQISQKQKSLQSKHEALEFLDVDCGDCNLSENKIPNNPDYSTIKEEFLEIEMDPVCNESEHSWMEDNTDSSSNDSWKPKKKRRKSKLKSRSQQELKTETYEIRCEICKEEVDDVNELYKHFETEHPEEQIYIKCCGKKITQRDSIDVHIKRHLPPEKYNCPICEKALTSEKKLLSHMKSIHDEDSKPFKCEVCQKEFKSKGSAKNHSLRHNKETTMIKCDKCQRCFSSHSRLRRHCQIMHEAVYPYKCQACEENFLFKKDMEAHKSVCKNRCIVEKGQKPSKKLSSEFICKICFKIFVTANRLSKHITFVHENIHPYVCDQCGKKFKFKPGFDNHMLQHAGVVEPPAQCNICGKWLKHKNSLRLHLYKHDNSVNKCELCDHKAPNRTALRHHVKKVHRVEREYQCKYCDKSFKDAKSQEEHNATHTGAQLYSCPHCLRESRSRSNMYAHIKRMHHDEWLKAKLARSYDPNAKIQLEVLA